MYMVKYTYIYCYAGSLMHVSAWYCLAPIFLTLCARLDDPSGSLHAQFWPLLVQWDHFRPSKAPAPTSAVAGPRPDKCGCRLAVSSLSGRPAAAAVMLPWAQGLAVLSRRPFWHLVHKTNVRPRPPQQKLGDACRIAL
jgi:hypothetical protein